MTAAILATLTASTKREPAPVGNIIGAPVTNIATLPITPLQSTNADMALEASIQDASETKVTLCFVDGNGDPWDVEEGDILVVSGTEYTIRSVAEFNRPASDMHYSRLIIQERKVSN